MAGDRNQSKPTFLWQAILILLPVIALAIVSLWSLRQDRAAVEREARERAGEFIESLARELTTRAGVRLALAQLQATHEQRWLFACSQWRTPQDPVRLFLSQVESPFAMESASTMNLISPKEGPSPDLVFRSNGNLVEPDENFAFLCPPQWRVELNSEQRAAWDDLCARQVAGDEPGAVENAIARFLGTSPPPHAQAAAEFARLRATLARAEPPDALAQWLRFAETCGGVLPVAGAYESSTNDWQGAESETGLPLSTLATLESLRTRTVRRFVPELWQAIVREVWFHPSLMTGPLLDSVEARAEGNDPYHTYVRRMREHLDHEERKRSLADLIRRSDRLSYGATNCCWIGEPPDRWLAVLQPCPTNTESAAANADTPSAATTVQVFLYPETAVVSAFSNALESVKGIRRVPFLNLSVELEDQSIPVPAAWSSTPGNSPAGRLFASAEGRLSSPAYTRESLTGGPSFGGRFEALPSQPRFRLAWHLADPGPMYAAHRRRALLSISLVAAAALAALVGLGAAWRSFHRQRALNEMKSNFVSSVSHELRAPIASVRLMAESLERGKISEPAKQGEYFRFIGQECRRLSSLIENVLDFSRIEQGRKQYEFEPTDLAALVQETVKLLEPNAVEKGVKLKWRTSNTQHPTSNIELNVDGRAIQQALVNLIDNAIKHSPKGETVTVGIEHVQRRTGVAPVSDSQTNRNAESLRHSGEELETGATPVLLSVEDHGTGIPASEHEKIFERFYRLGSELQRETQGVGIGLSIVKHIVEAHGGRVRVESEVSKGSRFTIELPLRELNK